MGRIEEENEKFAKAWENGQLQVNVVRNAQFIEAKEEKSIAMEEKNKNTSQIEKQ
jgi:hypothetical protein